MSDNPQNISRWMEAAAKEIASLEKMGHGLKLICLSQKLGFFPGLGFFAENGLQTEKSASLRPDIVSEATSRKANLKLLHLLWLGVLFVCFSSCR
jgi:hypothetical protein